MTDTTTGTAAPTTQQPDPATPTDVGVVTTTVKHLVRLLQSVAPITAREHPLLGCVRLSVTPGHDVQTLTLAAEATNRYVAARGRITVDGSPSGSLLGSVLVSGEDVRRVLDFVRSLLPDRWSDFNQDVAGIGYTEGAGTISFRFGTFTLTVPASPATDWPDMTRFIDGDEPPALTTPIRFDLAMLALLHEAHPGYSGRSVWTFTGEFGPARVTVGDWWTGVVMPCQERR